MTKKKLTLRRFQYLDEELVRQYLEQVPGGQEVLLRGARELKGEGSLAAGIRQGPLNVGGEKSRTTSERVEFEIGPSTIADFNRLHELATSQGSITELLPDPEIWDGLAPGELLELRAEFSRPVMYQVLAAAQTLKDWVPALKLFGEDVDEETLGTVEMVAKLLAEENPTLVATLEGVSRFQFAVKVNPHHMRVSIDEIEGEATVVGTLERKTNLGDHLDISEAVKRMQPKLPPQNRAARRRQARGKQAKGSPDEAWLDDTGLRLHHPAAILTPVAIFR